VNEVYTRKIEEHVVPGKRLGRHVRHDPKSRMFAYDAKQEELREVHHRRYGGPFDQGQIGSCTGNASAGVLNTVPVHIPRHRLMTETDAVRIYSKATIIDPYDGSYPPDDTGSDGLSVAKACLAEGLIREYDHAFGIDQALAALQERPFITGVNWYESMDEPDEHGFVTVAGQVRGGHEFEALGFIPRAIHDQDIIIFENSWSMEWGKRGRFYMRVPDFARLLDEEGDVTILV
jgi:hypothetical protein